jgi:hypothetical protein
LLETADFKVNEVKDRFKAHVEILSSQPSDTPARPHYFWSFLEFLD